MAKLDDAVDSLSAEMDKLGLSHDKALLTGVARGLGPALYKNDAKTVAASDKKELATVKKNFLIKKLGLEDSPALDAGIQKAIEKIGRSNRSKKRAIFYYLLVKEFKKESVYA